MHNRKNTGKPDLQTDLQNRAYEFFQDDQTAIQAAAAEVILVANFNCCIFVVTLCTLLNTEAAKVY